MARFDCGHRCCPQRDNAYHRHVVVPQMCFYCVREKVATRVKTSLSSPRLPKRNNKEKPDDA
jgi:hypothetical protein